MLGQIFLIIISKEINNCFSPKQYQLKRTIQILTIEDQQSMSKFYSVKVGRTCGIYTSWADCQAQTKGHSGALFKSFTTRAEAVEYLHDGNVPVKEQVVQISLIGGLQMKQDGRTPAVVSASEINNTKTVMVNPNINNIAKETNGGSILYNIGDVELPKVTGKNFLSYDRSMLNTSDRFTVIYIDGSKRPSIGHKGSGAYARFNNQDYTMSLPFTKEIAAKYEIKSEDVDKMSSPSFEYLAYVEVLWRFISFRVKEVLVEQKNEHGQSIIMKVPQKLDPPICLLFVSDYNGVKFFTDGSWTPEKDYIIKIRNTAWEIMKFLREKGVYISIKHINGHKGYLGNELSDIAAKSPVFVDTIPQLVTDMTNKFM